MTDLVRLVIGESYYLSGLAAVPWDAPHQKYGTPDALFGRYLGALQGCRRWHGFEIWIGDRESGVLVMNDQDLEQLTISTTTAY